MTSNAVLFLSLPGLDLRQINRLVDDSELPAFRKLIESGVSAEFPTFDPCLTTPHLATATSGLPPSQHAIASWGRITDDGLGIQRYERDDCVSSLLWEWSIAAGRNVNLLNWPLGDAPARSNTDGSGGLRFAVAELFGREPVLADDWTVADGDTDGEATAAIVRKTRVFSSNFPRATSQFPGCDESVIRRCLATALSVGRATKELLASDQSRVSDLTMAHLDLMPLFAACSEGDHQQRVLRLADDILDELQRASSASTIFLLSTCFASSGQRSPANWPWDVAASRVPRGCFLSSGPSIRADQLVHTLGLVDVAPTIAAAMGVPMPESLAGRVAVEIFSAIPGWTTFSEKLEPIEPVETIAAHADAIALQAIAPAHAALVASQLGDDQEVIRQLGDLDGLCETRFQLLGLSLARLERWPELGSLVAKYADSLCNTPSWQLADHAVRIISGEDAATATELLRNAQKSSDKRLEMLRVHLLIRAGAVDAANECLEGLANYLPAALIQSSLQMKAGEYHEALEDLLNLVGHQFYWPDAHRAIAICLFKLGRTAEAIGALELAIRQRPGQTAWETMLGRWQAMS